MKNDIDVNKLRADYWWDQISAQFSNFRVGFLKTLTHTWYLTPTFIFSVLGLAVILFILRKVLIFLKFLKQPSVLLELTPPAFTDKSALSTKQLFSALHDMGEEPSLINRLLGRKSTYSFEIVSTMNRGIRFLVRTTPNEENALRRTLISYLPQAKIKVVNDYLYIIKSTQNLRTKIVEYKLKEHFGFPLAKQEALNHHDPIAFITGQMTKLSATELISLQIVLSPLQTKETDKITWMIHNFKDVLKYMKRPGYPPYISPFILLLKILAKILLALGDQLAWVLNELLSGGNRYPTYQSSRAQPPFQQTQPKPERIYNSFEQATIQSIQDKIDQQLFESTIRLLVIAKNKQELKSRLDGFKSAIAFFAVPKYQALIRKSDFPPVLTDKIRFKYFKKRLLSNGLNSSKSLLSTSEVADLYHLPYRRVTQTENLVKSHSKELPAPISLKKGTKLDVVFGKNSYGGTTTKIGLTKEERLTHMYILGRTGSGKTTLMFSMAKSDIESGKGLCFIDPHGDVAEDLLASVPERRLNDLIYLSPIDLKYPININLLELTPGLEEDDAELEKEVVTEGVVSLFRKVFSGDENTNAHRIEYILRNTIYTAFAVKDCTIFTINKILTNQSFRDQIVSRLEDEDLIDFWKNEFGKAGDFQVVKMTQGVTAKVGRFLRSPTARRILEKPKSTIDFDEIINSGKILICNFSQGKIGEDTTKLLGTTILTKLQQAALKRAYIPEKDRRPFYLYVDEFQNFATQSFTKMITEGRKYRMPLIIAEQSTAQQSDKDIINIILANVTTVISFRNGNAIDEELMLNQFAPYLDPGDITNLSRYHFFIKISALESEEPFSGETIKIEIKKDQNKIDKLIQASRNNWATIYQKPAPALKTRKTEAGAPRNRTNRGKNNSNSEDISVLS